MQFTFITMFAAVAMAASINQPRAPCIDKIANGGSCGGFYPIPCDVQQSPYAGPIPSCCIQGIICSTA
ncbi:hypothetical protein F5B22DRAFT_598631 [Xylaria bambusicola]|uniref:uncharacterized protein n=1 Tax=Xylaria bambusicola TaxID=326684 RepID=UPI0020074B5F|nr:uncharacterized protein F5B22DRAFT_598631 [Xylaria bambusicola]KAI0520859.1 hypothetical protein F5B22DRAFT_598631 [Xylaria bambusicola]